MKQFLKTFLRTLLIIVNIILFCVLGIWYFFGFDLQWGLTWQAVTWGLPLLVAIIFVIFCIVKFIRNRKWQWGVSGICVGVLALVYTVLMLSYYSYYIVGAPVNGPKITSDTEENRILTLVLSTFFSDEYGYAVIKPETNTRFYGLSDSSVFMEEIGDDLNDSFAADYEDIETITTSVEELYNEFIGLNHQEMSLSLKSSPEDGYYIDYDGKFSRYFSDDFGGGWLRMDFFRPNVGPFTEVSFPVYDQDIGVVIIYLGMQSYDLMGEGGIWVFKYENNQLEPIAYCELWIS